MSDRPSGALATHWLSRAGSVLSEMIDNVTTGQRGARIQTDQMRLKDKGKAASLWFGGWHRRAHRSLWEGE